MRNVLKLSGRLESKSTGVTARKRPQQRRVKETQRDTESCPARCNKVGGKFSKCRSRTRPSNQTCRDFKNLSEEFWGMERI